MIVQSTAAVLSVALVSGMVAGAATPPGARTALPAASAALWTPGVLAGTRVTGISLLPGLDGAELVIAVDAASKVSDFTLDSPHRIVVDIIGAQLGVKPRSYDRESRGEIKDVRIAQFAVDTVRVVLELASKQAYVVRHESGEIRVRVTGATQFARWDMTPGGFAPLTRLAEHDAVVVDDAETEVVPDLAARLASLPAPTATLASQTAGLSNVSLAALTEPVRSAPLPLAEAQPEAQPEVQPEVQPALRRVDPPRVETVVAQSASEGLLEITNSSFSSVPPTVAVGIPLAIPRAPEVMRASRAQPSQQPSITITFDGTSIRDVIATFASYSSRTIVVGKNVEGTVTAEITDKPWDVALQAILQSQGLAATEDPSGIITVDSYGALAQNQSLEPLVTQIINVNYAKAASLVPTVRALLARDCSSLTTMQVGREIGGNTQGNQGARGANGQQDSQGCVLRGSVSADSATNKLIISEVPTRLPELIKRLQELDVRTPQVAIKAKIIFINRTGIQDIGLAYDLGTGTKQFFSQLVQRTDPSTLVPIDTDGDGVPDARGGGTPFQAPARISLGGNALSGIANANNAIKPNALNLIYSTALGRYQLTAFLNALQTSSLADVQSEPSVTILNNRTAEIFVGQEIPIRVIDASSGGSGGGGGGGGQDQSSGTFFPRASVQIKEAGIRLSVTPQVTNNRMVILDIKAENSNAEVGPSDVGIIFNQQRAESQVLVADGEAAVIGGLTVTEVSRFRSGIPFLMNLPFAGRFFSQNTTSETKRDLLILVTPHILEDGTTPPPGR